MTNSIETIISLCKRRGFIFAGSEIYGGLANAWDYGPVGVELKNNIKKLWWEMFVTRRDDMVGLDAAILMNPKVWEASGHLKEFSDPLVECKKCHTRFREDMLEERDGKRVCSNCGSNDFSSSQQFNLMLKTFLGPAEEKTSTVYFRPETAQAMFVNFKNVTNTSRVQVPFGMAQIGKAFRNEITPGNFIFRTREFEQMEVEYFIKPPMEEVDWQKPFEMWRVAMVEWIEALGISMERIHEYEVPDGDRAHYSKRTIDFEYEFPFGRKELYGLAYRGDFDLKNHAEASGENLEYVDPKTGEKFLPHVIEPSLGVDRTILAVLCEAYTTEGDGDKKRVVLKLPKSIAPFKAAVFPLLANKNELGERAREIYALLKKEGANIAWDDRGNIGKRYFAQDEIGTPWCITIDFETLEGKGVTVRNRDTAKQERIPVDQLKKYVLEGS